MSDERNKAIETLRRARDLLAERLTERIVESRDEILEDAMGLAFGSVIDEIHERIATQLAHVNTMLANLPEIHPPADSDVDPFEHASADAAGVMAAALLAAPPALPGPAPVAGLLSVSAPASFQTFAIQIFAGDVAGAGRSLAELFGVPPQRGLAAACSFHEKFQKQPEVMLKAAELRRELATGNSTRTAGLLRECFDFDHTESIEVIATLNARPGTG